MDGLTTNNVILPWSPLSRCCSQPQESFEMVSTTFRIPSPSRPHEPQELYTSESQDEAYYGETDSDGECPAGTRLVRTQVQIPASRNKSRGTNDQGGGDTSLEVTPGSVVELQLSLSKTTLEEPDCTALGSACGVVGDSHQRKTDKSDNYTTTAFTPGNPSTYPDKTGNPLASGVCWLATPCFARTGGGDSAAVIWKQFRKGGGRGQWTVGFWWGRRRAHWRSSHLLICVLWTSLRGVGLRIGEGGQRAQQAPGKARQ